MKNRKTAGIRIDPDVHEQMQFIGGHFSVNWSRVAEEAIKVYLAVYQRAYERSQEPGVKSVHVLPMDFALVSDVRDELQSLLPSDAKGSVLEGNFIVCCESEPESVEYVYLPVSNLQEVDGEVVSANHWERIPKTVVEQHSYLFSSGVLDSAISEKEWLELIERERLSSVSL